MDLKKIKFIERIHCQNIEQYQRKRKYLKLLVDVFVRSKTDTLNNNADDKMDLKETFTTILCRTT